MVSIQCFFIALIIDLETEVLKEHLMEELDYSLVPEKAWSHLVRYYGLSEDSKPIARRVVEYGLYTKHCKMEVYQLNLKLSLHPKLSETTVETISRSNTVGMLLYSLCVYNAHVCISNLCIQ